VVCQQLTQLGRTDSAVGKPLIYYSENFCSYSGRGAWSIYSMSMDFLSLNQFLFGPLAKLIMTDAFESCMEIIFLWIFWQPGVKGCRGCKALLSSIHMQRPCNYCKKKSLKFVSTFELLEKPFHLIGLNYTLLHSQTYMMKWNMKKISKDCLKADKVTIEKKWYYVKILYDTSIFEAILQ